MAKVMLRESGGVTYFYFAKKDMEEILPDIMVKTPEIRFINNVDANFSEDSDHIKKSLVRQITGQVRWRETILLMENHGIENIVEIGSGKVLTGLTSRTCKNINTKSIQNIKDIEELVA